MYEYVKQYKLLPKISLSIKLSLFQNLAPNYCIYIQSPMNIKFDILQTQFTINLHIDRF